MHSKLIFFLLFLFTLSFNVQAKNDAGLQFGLNSTFGIHAHHEFDKKIDIRGFFYSYSGCLSSLGGAGLYKFKIDKTDGFYAGAGLQMASLSGSCTNAPFTVSGTTLYLAGGWRKDLNKDLRFNAEYNNFQGLAVGIVYKF